MNRLTEDVVESAQIIKEINQMPQFEITRLCNLFTEKIKEYKLDDSTKDIENFQKQWVCASYVALQEGILPQTLFILWMKRNK